MSDKRHRVSAKQRLEIVAMAIYEFQNNILEKEEFIAVAIDALRGPLEPKNKSTGENE